MAELTLYIGNKNHSSWSLRPWLALKQAGAVFNEVLIPLDQPDTARELARISPTGRIPVLVHGELHLWESLAICEYVAELFPAAKLWPEDRNARALARAVSHEMHAGFAALRQVYSMNIHGRIEKALTPELSKDIARVQKIWRTCLENRPEGSGPFLFGHFTIADAMFAPVVSRFRTYGAVTGKVETAYRAVIEALPSYQEWVSAAEREKWVLPNH